jgi:hypothetical protein
MFISMAGDPMAALITRLPAALTAAPTAAPATSPTSGHSGSGGLFLLAWGLFASAFGLAMVTNFRGFADTFTRNAHASSSGLRSVPPWKWQRQPESLAGRTVLLRMIAIPFAVLGPIVTVAGIVTMARGHISIPRSPAAPLPFAVAAIAFGVMTVVQYWRPRGFLRVAASRGGWRRVVAILSSAGAMVFAVCLAVGQMTIGILAWMVCGLPLIALFADRGQVSDREKAETSFISE